MALPMQKGYGSYDQDKHGGHFEQRCNDTRPEQALRKLA